MLTRPPAQKKLPQYIHFTLQKSNRETLDALAHLSRLFNCNSKDLSVCGTKDKRAVTVQRVCLRRGHRTLDALWKTANGIKLGRRNLRTAVSERAERGTRIGDLEYSDRYLELGMLRGNYFVITLRWVYSQVVVSRADLGRNVQTENQEEIDSIMISLRDRGFINFYGEPVESLLVPRIISSSC
jgi:tRNA pseudouridine13 synthase